MKYQLFTLGDLETNCYLVWSGQAAGVIDPGGPPEPVCAAIDRSGLQLQWILNTHGHSDHIAGNAALQGRYAAPILIHEADRGMLLSATANLSVFLGPGMVSPDAEATLTDGEWVPLGDGGFRVIAVPGHTPGSIALYTDGLLFCGDSLFRESVGRTDFPGGDQRQLISAIRNRLFCLPSETRVLPGHGPATDIAHEMRFNPFAAGEDEILD
jgi:hydroxyacylglutathione hydrolase